MSDKSYVELNLNGRVVHWQMSDDAAFEVAQMLTQAFGPAKEGSHE